MENLNAEQAQAIEDLKAEHATEIVNKDNLIAAKDEEIAKLQGEIEFKQKDLDEKAAALEAKETELTAAKTELEGAKASLTTAEQTLAERDQQITDLNAQITELQNNPGEAPQAGAAPQNNGGGADAPAAVVNRYVWNRELSAEENWKLEEQWNKEHGIEK